MFLSAPESSAETTDAAAYAEPVRETTRSATMSRNANAFPAAKANSALKKTDAELFAAANPMKPATREQVHVTNANR